MRVMMVMMMKRLAIFFHDFAFNTPEFRSTLLEEVPFAVDVFVKTIISFPFRALDVVSFPRSESDRSRRLGTSAIQSAGMGAGPQIAIEEAGNQYAHRIVTRQQRHNDAFKTDTGCNTAMRHSPCAAGMYSQ